MGNYNQDNKFSRGGNSNRRSFSDRGSRGPSIMHQAVCDKCGKECEVPFKPTSGKPVFCSDCFEKNGASDSRRSEGSNFERPRYNDRQNSSFDRPMFDAVCDKCGNDCKIPFQPRSGKPIYCNNCFEKNSDSDRSNEGRNNDQYKQQFESLNNKLDSILRLLAPETAVELPVQDEITMAEITEQSSEEQISKTEKKPRASKKTAASIQE